MSGKRGMSGRFDPDGPMARTWTGRQVKDRAEADELVRRYQSGDRDAGDTLIRGSVAIMRSVLKRYSPDNELEACAFITAWRCLERYRPGTGTKWSSYLCQSLANNLFREWQRSKKEAMVQVWDRSLWGVPVPDTTGEVDDADERAVLLRRVRRAMRGLDPGQARVIAARYFGRGMTQAAAGERLGRDPSSVGRSEHQAIVKLRRWLAA